MSQVLAHLAFFMEAWRASGIYRAKGVPSKKVLNGREECVKYVLFYNLVEVKKDIKINSLPWSRIFFAESGKKIQKKAKAMFE
ncbi:hypothetical protein [Marinomonas gallaica]|uniref:hypothetical protein n=1 Tax=Marinomonas gallaica TaxID=1806667 RepID=UPI0011124042|nr:hypothetical protein [Marinomonas gallaica]